MDDSDSSDYYDDIEAFDYDTKTVNSRRMSWRDIFMLTCGALFLLISFIMIIRRLCCKKQTRRGGDGTIEAGDGAVQGGAAGDGQDEDTGEACLAQLAQVFLQLCLACRSGAGQRPADQQGGQAGRAATARPRSRRARRVAGARRLFARRRRRSSPARPEGEAVEMEQVGPSTEGFQTVELHSPPAGATAASEENRGRESPPCYSTLFRKGSTETLDQFEDSVEDHTPYVVSVKQPVGPMGYLLTGYFQGKPVLSPICDKRADLVANVSASAPPFLDEVGAYETGAKAKNAIVEPSISDMKEQMEIEDLMQRSLDKAGFITPAPLQRGRKELDLNAKRRSSIRLSKKEKVNYKV